ncbi:putative beta-lysine N-acetyltransferase [Halobacillus sp. B29]|uniref:putative beta-lysine N-acetyltransferase n=1 Tax=Halobacillus sp. B29 TaxID=3457432 RepID=UPI003FCDD27C
MISGDFLSAGTLMEKSYFDVELVSRRVKVYDLPDDVSGFIKELTQAAYKKDCDKLIFYVKTGSKEEADLQAHSCKIEGEIKGFFRGDDTRVYAKYLNPAREKKKEGNVIDYVKQLNHTSTAKTKKLMDGYTMKWGREENAEEMAELYQTAFAKYPTPIHNPEYIVDMMKDHVHFALIFKGEKLVSACSADVFPEYKAAEFTDCATLPEHRGKGLLSHQYPFLEEKAKELGINTMFSYTRATSMGMNIVAAQQGFTYGGCMIQNSWIGTGLEDMNIWYKIL